MYKYCYNFLILQFFFMSILLIFNQNNRWQQLNVYITIMYYVWYIPFQAS